MKFYGLALDKDNNSVLIDNLPNVRHEAVSVAQEYCKKNKLRFEEVRPVFTPEKKGSILTKTIESKKGRKLIW